MVTHITNRRLTKTIAALFFTLLYFTPALPPPPPLLWAAAAVSAPAAAPLLPLGCSRSVAASSVCTHDIKNPGSVMSHIYTNTHTYTHTLPRPAASTTCWSAHADAAPPQEPQCGADSLGGAAPPFPPFPPGYPRQSCCSHTNYHPPRLTPTPTPTPAGWTNYNTHCRRSKSTGCRRRCCRC